MRIESIRRAAKQPSRRQHLALSAARTCLATLVFAGIALGAGRNVYAVAVGTGVDRDSREAASAAGPAFSGGHGLRTEVTPSRFTIAAGGDVLLHGVVNQAALRPDGDYDYSTILAGLDPWIQGADLALCNMETPIVAPGAPIMDFPRFAVPPQIARDLAARGWDGCSTATNHTVDQGFAGVVATLDTFDQFGLGAVGSARSAVEADQPQLYQLERGGQVITVAHLAQTWSTNLIPVPKGQPWAVETLNVNRLLAQAQAARDAGADLVVVSLHAGIEYTTQLHQVQVTVPPQLANSGLIDLVIGNHPHVPQGITRLPGGPEGRGMWVAYSLGNMITGQTDSARSTGLLIFADVVTEPGEHAWIENVQWTASVIDRFNGYQLHAMPDLLANPALTGFSTGELGKRHNIAIGAVTSPGLERTTPPIPTGPAPVVVRRAR